MKHSTLNIQRSTSNENCACSRRSVERWALNVQCSMFFVLSFLLVGCVSYKPQPISLEQTASNFEGRSLNSDALKVFIEANLGRDLAEWPPPRWNLELLTLAAYYYQPSLDVARAQWRVAEAAAISAGARPNPTMSFAPGLNSSAVAGENPWLLGLGFDWPVETAGKRGLRVMQAKQLTAAAHFNLITVAWQVRANVRDGLAAYRFAGNQSATLGEKVRLQKELVAKLEQRLSAGAIPSAEVTPARVALGKLESEFNVARDSEAAAAARVADAIGVPLRVFKDAPREMTLYTPQLSDEKIAEAKKFALLNRADLLAALSEYAASETALHLEIAKQYPDVRLSPGYEFDQGANKWRIGLSLELPVLNRNQGPIAEAKAKRDESAARFMALQAKVISEIETAAQSFQRVRKSHFDFIPAVNESVKQEHAMEAQVRVGAADVIDLLNVKLERQANNAAFEETGYRMEQAFGQLEDAMQQLLEVRPNIIAPPPPPKHLDLNPREEKQKL